MARVLSWTRRAHKDLRALDPQVAVRVRKAAQRLADDGYGDVERVQGENPPRYRLRVGDWRVIFELGSEGILVHAVGHRREVYR